MREQKEQWLWASSWNKIILIWAMTLPKVGHSREPLSFLCFQYKNEPTNNIHTYIELLCTGEYVDMVKAGIIDPLKVIRTALVDAAR